MNIPHLHHLPSALSKGRLSVASLTLAAASAWASPGAHGPNGEHLDAGAGAQASNSAAPRLEAKSEQFELVARLQGGELSILIDKFATNEPVLQASVEVKSGALKAPARFHEDLGDYAVDDPAMLQLLATPGDHALVFTVLAGQESDLLDGVLKVASTDAAAHNGTHGAGYGHEHRAGPWAPWPLGIGVVLALCFAAWRWQRAGGGDAVSRRLKGEQA